MRLWFTGSCYLMFTTSGLVLAKKKKRNTHTHKIKIKVKGVDEEGFLED